MERPVTGEFVWFLAGLWAGGILGVLGAALCRASAASDEAMRRAGRAEDRRRPIRAARR